MSQHPLPFLFYRGGTSRGPFFNRADLPENSKHLAQVLIAVMGAGQSNNIDGIGGGVAVTTKVAMLSRSDDPNVDIDYFFAQVSVEERRVDFKPTCGNMLAGVGPAAIEMGLITAQQRETPVRVRAVNTGALIDIVIQTPNAQMHYEGTAAIDGVPGTAAPVSLMFRETVGAGTGMMLPTGLPLDVIDGIPVTCLDVAMPVVIARADTFGLTGYETAQELDDNMVFTARREKIRVQAGALMGMGDVSDSVTPKFALIAPAQQGGQASVRYFMPVRCHPTLAVTGAQCLASCLLLPGSVAEGLCSVPERGPLEIVLEHPSGQMAVNVNYHKNELGLELISAGVMRTARLLARGEVMVPASIWAS